MIALIKKNTGRVYQIVFVKSVVSPAVAKAFGESVAPHPELVRLCKMFYKTDDLNSPAMKLACVPKSAKLNFGFDRQGKRTLYPNVSIKNVYIFPGIPQLMEKSFSILSEDLFGAGNCKFFMKELYIKSPEDSIAGPLSSTAKEFPNVTFGSYPELFQRLSIAYTSLPGGSSRGGTRLVSELSQRGP
uniref:(California timema) hypothetical protein n=1 Tax=Timema californicum TaxID=61474 RepID=A0A7R9J8I8_TIMCA|nr:unnamed protein product [Timema californicum]